jgi:hypothetical protein
VKPPLKVPFCKLSQFVVGDREKLLFRGLLSKFKSSEVYETGDSQDGVGDVSSSSRMLFL